MASDNLNQVGRNINRIKNDADYASRKFAVRKQIERTRDVFDTAIPFEMDFKTHHEGDRVHLDLKFNKPPPRKGCVGKCFSNYCETFTFDDGNDHLIQLQNAYIADTVRVFRNRTLLSSSSFSEYNPDQGQVYVQGSGTDLVEITVCYVTGACVFEVHHQYSGSFAYLSDGGGLNNIAISGSIGGTTFYSTNETALNFAAGSTWSWSIGMIVHGGAGGDHDTGHQVGIMDSTGNWHLPHESDVPISNVNILAWSGTTFFSLPLTNVYVASSTSAGQHIRKDVICNWYFDELGTLEFPESGQRVINDVVIPSTVNNSQGSFKTLYPYQAGTLEVIANGTPITVVETDPNNGYFTITDPSFSTFTVPYVIKATYVAA